MPQSGGLLTPNTGLVLAAGILVFLLTVQVSLMVWVYRDARARGSDRPGYWTALTIPPIGVLGFPRYLHHRHRRLGDRAKPPTRLGRLLATVASAGLAAMLLGTVLTPPDPYSQITWLSVGFLALLPPAYVLVYRGTYRQILRRLDAGTRP